MVNESSSHPMYDRIRAWVRGTAPEHEAHAFERALAAQPELARAAEEFREVHEITRPVRDEVPASRLQFSELEARIAGEERARRPQSIRRAAASIAATLLAAAAITFAVARRDRGPETLRLSAIALDKPANPTAIGGPLVPAVLAHYAPVRGDEIEWIKNQDDAEAIARAVDRPVLLFGMFETCPFCIQMKAEGLRDPGVLALVRNYVPLEIDLLNVTDEQRENYFARGYPLFEVHGENGEIVHSFPGFHDAPEFIDELQQGLDKSPERASALDWTSANRAAQALESAREAEAQGKLGLAHKDFVEVDGKALRGTLAQAAKLGIERIADSAHDALFAARDLAAHDSPGAERSLEDAARRFEGSPYSNDFEAALTSMRRTGRFPELAAAPR